MKYLSQISIILSFTLIGEVLQRVVPLPIPASVYGLVLLFCSLCFGIVKLDQVKKTADFLRSLLPLLFVPPTVGIMEHWGMITPHLVPIVLLLIGGTGITLVVSGLVTKWFSGKEGEKDGTNS